ncbi:MAG TPA: endonuclease/exonuclease/phosphatase family protein [Patescibacteria group bacterium]|nr:endonuclease/exonuclease/phosphatase family protein [Patescibacteria group bacterium]
MWYYNIPRDAQGMRIAQRLIAVKDALEADEGVPPKSEDTLLIATWNIREFDSPSYGERGIEPLYYIAEIISHFDLVAVQEVRENLKALDTVKGMLGGWWKYIATDVTEGAQGNRERMAFLFDSRKVVFGNIAGEVVIPPFEKKSKGKKTVYDPARQLYRTPFLCGFKASWAKFMLCTVHILYGESAPEDPARVEEIRRIATFLAGRAEEKSSWSNNMILMGDFNIFSPGDVTMQEILKAGFTVPAELQNLPQTNTGKESRHYDQIAFIPKTRVLQSTGRAGVFNYFNTVYRDGDEGIYSEEMGGAYLKTSKGVQRSESGRSQYYRTYWRTYQMSDHLPMWVELKTDFGREYLGTKTGS